MWPQTFGDRLDAWIQLRQAVQPLPTEEALTAINKWWFTTPWRAYHLHWDDRPTWPDPWQLLDDNIYCSLARGLGIMYTMYMLDREDMQDAVLAEFGGDNLVLVAQKKYILNWDSTSIVNISPGDMKSRHSVTIDQIQQQLR